MEKVRGWKEKICILLVLLILIVLFLLTVCGCAHQQPMQLGIPLASRVVVKEISVDPNKKTGLDPNLAEASYLLPDLTKGYIKNESYPLAVRVWWLNEAGGKDILLGSEGNIPPGPAEFYFGIFREFNFPPGNHRLVVERWKHFRNYGWRKEKEEIVKIEVGRLSRGNWFSSAEIGHYNWAVIVGPDRSRVYEGGRVP